MFIDPEDAPPPIDLNKAADAVDAAEEINNTADTASADQEHAGADDTSGTYAPDRPLPRDENGRPIPDADDPHTQLGKKTSERTGETYNQAREFGPDGKPVRDVDFTDHGRQDHQNPHEHRYDPVTGKRGRAQPIPAPTDKPPKKIE